MLPISISEIEVYRILKKLDSSKSIGPDGISAEIWNLLKETASELAAPLTFLFNASLQTRSLPKNWKLPMLFPCTRKELNLCWRITDLSP